MAIDYTIGQIRVPITDSGTTAAKTIELKDTAARTDIASLQAAVAALQGGSYFLGVTTTPLEDGGHTNPIVITSGGLSKTVYATNGNMTIYGQAEYVFSKTGDVYYERHQSGSKYYYTVISNPSQAQKDAAVNVTDNFSVNAVNTGDNQDHGQYIKTQAGDWCMFGDLHELGELAYVNAEDLKVHTTQTTANVIPSSANFYVGPKYTTVGYYLRHDAGNSKYYYSVINNPTAAQKSQAVVVTTAPPTTSGTAAASPNALYLRYVSTRTLSASEPLLVNAQGSYSGYYDPVDDDHYITTVTPNTTATVGTTVNVDTKSIGIKRTTNVAVDNSSSKAKALSLSGSATNYSSASVYSSMTKKYLRTDSVSQISALGTPSTWQFEVDDDDETLVITGSNSTTPSWGNTKYFATGYLADSDVAGTAAEVVADMSNQVSVVKTDNLTITNPYTSIVFQQPVYQIGDTSPSFTPDTSVNVAPGGNFSAQLASGEVSFTGTTGRAISSVPAQTINISGYTEDPQIRAAYTAASVISSYSIDDIYIEGAEPGDE